MNQADRESSIGVVASDICAGLRLISRALTLTARGGPSTFWQAPRLHPESAAASEAAPVWMSALIAANCQARSNGLQHTVRWRALSGRAIYTNFGSYTEQIEPLGVHLPAGDTVAVFWSPGETGYTVEVYSDAEKCA
jgi:hypothetical protein